MGEFPDEVVRRAWAIADGRCERCRKQLVWENRGRRTGRGAWEAHHRVSQEAGGASTYSNCGILCWDCHTRICKRTL